MLCALQRVATYKGLLLSGTPPHQAVAEATAAAHDTEVTVFEAHIVLPCMPTLCVYPPLAQA